MIWLSDVVVMFGPSVSRPPCLPLLGICTLFLSQGICNSHQMVTLHFKYVQNRRIFGLSKINTKNKEVSLTENDSVKCQVLAARTDTCGLQEITRQSLYT
jgi:hypothetical protein